MNYTKMTYKNANSWVEFVAALLSAVSSILFLYYSCNRFITLYETTSYTFDLCFGLAVTVIDFFCFWAIFEVYAWTRIVAAIENTLIFIAAIGAFLTVVWVLALVFLVVHQNSSRAAIALLVILVCGVLPGLLVRVVASSTGLQAPVEGRLPDAAWLPVVLGYLYLFYSVSEKKWALVVLFSAVLAATIYQAYRLWKLSCSPVRARAYRKMYRAAFPSIVSWVIIGSLILPHWFSDETAKDILGLILGIATIELIYRMLSDFYYGFSVRRERIRRFRKVGKYATAKLLHREIKLAKRRAKKIALNYASRA
jgi:hypothetical protein